MTSKIDENTWETLKLKAGYMLKIFISKLFQGVEDPLLVYTLKSFRNQNLT